MYPLSTYGTLQKDATHPTCKGDIRFGGPDRTFNDSFLTVKSPARSQSAFAAVKPYSFLAFFPYGSRRVSFQLTPLFIPPRGKTRRAPALWTPGKGIEIPFAPYRCLDVLFDELEAWLYRDVYLGLTARMGMSFKSGMRMTVNILLLAIAASSLIVNRSCHRIFYNVFRCLGISTKGKIPFTPFSLKPLRSPEEMSYIFNS